jgi:hypothetical protein
VGCVAWVKWAVVSYSLSGIHDKDCLQMCLRASFPHSSCTVLRPFVADRDKMEAKYVQAGETMDLVSGYVRVCVRERGRWGETEGGRAMGKGSQETG